MIVVTYFTDRKYRIFARRLQESCTKWALHCALYAERDTGSWEKNVYRKPHVIMKALNDYPSEAILFVDADASLVAYPQELVMNDWDVACYFDGPRRPVSGTVYLKNNERARSFVAEWARGCDKGNHENEDYHWMRLALEKSYGIRVGHLPPAYFWVERTMRGRFPMAVPVVNHYTIGEHTFQ